MKDIFQKMNSAVKHLEILHEVFLNKENFEDGEGADYNIYKENEEKLRELLDELNFRGQLYSQKGRQMILADLLEYIFLGRGYYSMQSPKDKERFVKAILHFVNLLMCYETMTVSKALRNKFLEKLNEKVPETSDEELFINLKDFKGKVGLKRGESEASKDLDKYFDSLLPKTAGGLWHELLVYIFLLRNNFGYIVPLLLSQRLVSLHGNIVPPDFLVITHDKHIYGIEVGTKKEIQSGSFSLETAIPTATIDTRNSRTSDRCPICKKWIPFCNFTIEKYSTFNIKITKSEVRCLDECQLYSKEDIAEGNCPHTKYYRGNKAKTLKHAQHEYANGLHYHYRCVLKQVSIGIRKEIVNAKDTIALKTHYPYYSGMEKLLKKWRCTWDCHLKQQTK